jgi:hypothetical protein
MLLWLRKVALLAPLLGLVCGSELKTGAAVPAAPADKTEGTCSTFGTSVEFVDSPSIAATQAKKEQKLVFVLHVSGNFEDPRFT